MPRDSRVLNVEKKTLTFERNENQAGEFLRITEETAGRQHKNAIVIPWSGVMEAAKTLMEMSHVGSV